MEASAVRLTVVAPTPGLALEDLIRYQYRMPMRDHVFVYGTLRHGGYNHMLLEQARFRGPHVTEPRFTMMHLGPYPGVVEEGGTAIVGEVYAVTPMEFREIDRLEDYPRTYTRRRIDTPWGSAWIYILRVRAGRAVPIASGDWFQG